MSELKDLLAQLELTEDNRLMLGEVAVIMMPAWFFSGILKRVKEQAGPEIAAKVYYEAGWEGAYNWSKVQLAKGLKGREVMAQYLGSMTVRGWGRFEIVEFDQAAGTGLFRYHNSAVALQQGNVGEAICYWVPGGPGRGHESHHGGGRHGDGGSRTGDRLPGPGQGVLPVRGGAGRLRPGG